MRSTQLLALTSEALHCAGACSAGRQANNAHEHTHTHKGITSLHAACSILHPHAVSSSCRTMPLIPCMKHQCMHQAPIHPINLFQARRRVGGAPGCKSGSRIALSRGSWTRCRSTSERSTFATRYAMYSRVKKRVSEGCCLLFVFRCPFESFLFFSYRALPCVGVLYVLLQSRAGFAFAAGFSLAPPPSRRWSLPVQV